MGIAIYLICAFAQGVFTARMADEKEHPAFMVMRASEHR